MFKQDNTNYFGVFEGIAEQCDANVKFVEFYNDYYSIVYDRITDDNVNNSEIEFYYRYAALYKGPILELACGSGRITLRLAKKKFNVVGVDINNDMLSILQNKLDNNHKRLKPYVELYQQDITNIKLPDRYKLVILPATTIRLINIDYIDFINSIYEIVEEDGCFIFDFVDNYDGLNQIKLAPPVCYSFVDGDNHYNVVWTQEELNSITKKSRVNFFTTVFSDKVEAYLSYTNLNMFSYQQIEDMLKKTKFKDYQIFEYAKDIYFCVLKK